MLHGSHRPRWPHGSATVAATQSPEVSKHAPQAEGGGCSGCERGWWLVSGADGNAAAAAAEKPKDAPRAEGWTSGCADVEGTAAAAAEKPKDDDDFGPKDKSAIIVLGEIDGVESACSSEMSQPSLRPFSRAAASCCPGRGTGMEARARQARHVRKHDTPGTCRAGASVCISTII